MNSPDDLERQLQERQGDLERYVRRHAGPGLLRYESVEDLVQGIHLEALRSRGTFEYRGEEELLGWLFRVARNHIYHRAAHWQAAKRDSAGVMRLVAETGGFDPPASGTSPSSFAGRREQLVLVTRALSALPDRDRQLLGRCLKGATIDDLANEFGMTYEAAKHARQRALERLRKTHRLILRAQCGPG